MITTLIDAGLATLTIDQPNSRANTLSTAMWAVFAAALADLRDTPNLEGLILTSAKEGIFIAGADIKELASLPADDPEPTRRLLQAGHDVLAELEKLPFPTVAAVDGACLGGGCEVALACDYRIAGSHPKCKLGLPEIKLGLIPGWGGTQRLPRMVGPTRAAEILLTGFPMTPSEAQTAGLVDRTTTSESLPADAAALLRSAQRDDWTARRRRKQEPLPGPVEFADLQPMVDALPEEERLAGNAALDVIRLGAPETLNVALRFETDHFVPLLAGDAAQKRLAGFLKR